MNEELFQKNLELWSLNNPKEAVLLQYFECTHLEICPADDGLLNLKSTRDPKTQVFYETNRPIEEAFKWFTTLKVSNAEVIYVYGIGLGYYYDALIEWLSKNPGRHVVFLEDDLEVIAKFFETEKASTLLQDTQTSLYFFREIAEAEQFFNQLFWNFPMTNAAFGALEYYKKVKGDRFQELVHQLTYDAAVKNSLVKEYLEYGTAFFRNFYTNIFHINKAFLGNALFDQFKGIPAIICGAGPSLQKNIPFLKMAKNKAIIMAGSSALNALAANGIQPDLGAGIDPNPMQEERLKTISNLNFPFLYRGRVYPGALACVTGPKLYITGSGGYDIAEFFENRFEIDGKFIEEGRNVVNFCLEAAFEMGCNPIIFIGMDLAFTDKKAYAEGVVDNPLILEPNDTVVSRKDIYENPVETMWKWVSEAKWIGDFAHNHPERTLINATEGGLGFPGIPNKKFEEVLKEYVSKEHPIHSKLKSIISQNPLSKISNEKILATIAELKESLQKCIDFLQILTEENKKTIEALKENHEETSLQTGKAMLAEMDLAEEPAFVYVLQIFNEVASKLMQRDLMKLFDPNNPAEEHQKELEKLELNKQKYNFLSRVAQVNLKLIVTSHTTDLQHS